LLERCAFAAEAEDALRPMVFSGQHLLSVFLPPMNEFRPLKLFLWAFIPTVVMGTSFMLLR